MIIRARTVVTMDGPPIENGAVLVDGASIVEVGSGSDIQRWDDGAVLDLGDVALMPGLINAHCHLDYSTMRYAISYKGSFTAWVQRINAVKRTLDSDDYLAAIARGFKELRRSGTTTVCNIESFPELMPLMPEPPIRVWWFYEMIDVRHRLTTEEVVMGALSFFQGRTNSLNRFGLSPHAPYTASRMLYGLANSCASTMTMMLTTHVAESREETEMFLEGEGELFEFLKRLGRPMDDCGYQTPFAHLWNSGAVNAKWLLVHMNDLKESDFQLLGGLAKSELPNVVHCPGSHRYFGHPPFPFRRLQSLGVNISLGTDSLASGYSLSLFDEMRMLRRNEPWLTAEDLLKTVTLNPARALNRENRLGCIRPGAMADLIAVPVQTGDRNVYEKILENRAPVEWCMVDGRVCA